MGYAYYLFIAFITIVRSCFYAIVIASAFGMSYSI